MSTSTSPCHAANDRQNALGHTNVSIFHSSTTSRKWSIHTGFWLLNDLLTAEQSPQTRHCFHLFLPIWKRVSEAPPREGHSTSGRQCLCQARALLLLEIAWMPRWECARVIRLVGRLVNFTSATRKISSRLLKNRPPNTFGVHFHICRANRQSAFSLMLLKSTLIQPPSLIWLKLTISGQRKCHCLSWSSIIFLVTSR